MDINLIYLVFSFEQRSSETSSVNHNQRVVDRETDDRFHAAEDVWLSDQDTHADGRLHPLRQWSLPKQVKILQS